MAAIETTTDTRRVADAYFDAIAAGDVGAAVACWAPGGVDRIIGVGEHTAPDGVREFLGEMLRAMPDLRLEVVERTIEGDRAAYRFTVAGTFAGRPLQGVQATGAAVAFEGVDVLKVRDGRIVANDSLLDQMSIARAIGLVPPAGSRADRGLTRAFNGRTRAAMRVAGARPEQVADGVWIVRGGLPLRAMNVYLIRDGDGVMLFDAGVRSMVPALARAAAQLGGITRIVLGHAHPDHRGAAPGLAAPVYVHPDDRADAEGDGGDHYFDFSRLDPHGRVLLQTLLHHAWDGGPVTIAGTVQEGDALASGFRVVHLPGHAPGLIGLWRETDRVALTTDCFYTLDPQTGRKGRPRVPHAAFNADTELARASIRKLAALEPFAAFPGHADPLKGDVREQLETAAATT